MTSRIPLVAVALFLGACAGARAAGNITPEQTSGTFTVRNQSTCYLHVSSAQPRGGVVQRLAEVSPGGSTVVTVPEGLRLHTLFVAGPNVEKPEYGLDCRGTGPVTISRVLP